MHREHHGEAQAQAFRWRKMRDEGVRATLETRSRAKGVRDLRQPDSASHAASAGNVEAILGGRQPGELQLDDLLVRFPLEWELQWTIAGR